MRFRSDLDSYVWNRRIQPESRERHRPDSRGPGPARSDRRARRRRGRLCAIARRPAPSTSTSSAPVRASSSTASPFPTRRPRCSSTCATTRRVIRRSPANNHPVRHGAVVGDPQRDHPQRRGDLRPARVRARRSREMTVDTEAIFALASEYGLSRRGARGALRLDGDGVVRRAPPRHALPRPRRRPAALARRGQARGLLRVDEARARGRRALSRRSG